jgi:hypothetical protein
MCDHHAWLYTPVDPALRRQRQEDHKFKAILGYIEKPCLKKKKKKKEVKCGC